ncbi:MAG: L,D-transpeptidase family protein [Campylobacterota bacterium]|nr:L,D-transpeptidase family protein [Campylobacterota bacterium]
MKIVISLLTLLYNLSFAISFDTIDTYRTQGIKEIERKIEQQLQKKEYWDYFLSSVNTSNGYYESIQYLMICQKDMKNIDLYDTKTQKKIFYSSVFTGKENGDKKIEGDMKTPIGAYNLTRRLTNLDPYYGPLALTTNYPNIYDKAQGKTGHGIWIHGVPQDDKRDDFTQGCIALDNTKIKKLDTSINIDNSVLLITENSFPITTKDDISTILVNLYSWKSAWKNSDIDKYLSFYDEEFIKSDGKNLKSFSKYKTRVFNKNEKKTIKFKDINIIPYPNSNNKKLFKIVFNELYKTSSYTFNGKKSLYVELKEDKFYILTES